MTRRLITWIGISIFGAVLFGTVIYPQLQCAFQRQIGGSVFWSLPGKDIPDLTKEAGTIVIGTVQGKIGSVEDNSEWRGADVYTDFAVTPKRFLKNPQPEKELVVRLAGGIAKCRAVKVEGEASLESGETVLLFLGKARDGEWTVVGASQGKYKLSGGKAINLYSEKPRSVLEKEILRVLAE